MLFTLLIIWAIGVPVMALVFYGMTQRDPVGLRDWTSWTWDQKVVALTVAALLWPFILAARIISRFL